MGWEMHVVQQGAAPPLLQAESSELRHLPNVPGKRGASRAQNEAMTTKISPDWEWLQQINRAAPLAQGLGVIRGACNSPASAWAVYRLACPSDPSPRISPIVLRARTWWYTPPLQGSKLSSQVSKLAGLIQARERCHEPLGNGSSQQLDWLAADGDGMQVACDLDV